MLSYDVAQYSLLSCVGIAYQERLQEHTFKYVFNTDFQLEITTI